MKLDTSPKTVMAVTLTVMFGLLFGVAGYLTISKSKINPPVVITPPPAEKEITITTDKTEYEQGETARITVNNNLDEDVCFESCNTYYFQKKNWTWEEYLMKRCEVSFITECVNPLEIKEFKDEFSKVDFEKGTYRIAVPVYIGCQNEEYPCEEVKKIYSNEFTIKEKTSEVLTPDYVLAHSKELVGKKILIKGTATTGTIGRCTEKICLSENPCCNYCGGPLMLKGEKDEIAISGEYDEKSVGCSGNECGLNKCYPLEIGKFYVVAGKWVTNKWNYSSLDIESYEEKSAIDPRCGQKFKGDGICDVEIKGIEFNTNMEKCVEVYSSGCKLVNIPFQTLEECQKVCESGLVSARTCTIEIPKDMKLQSLSRYDVKTNDTAFKSLTVSDDLCFNSYASGESGYYLVQFDGPITEDEKKQIESLGGKPYGYVPQHSFIYKMDETVKNKAQALKFIKWIGIYQPAFRIAPSISDEMIKSDSKQILNVSIFDANYKDIVSKIEKLGGTAEYMTKEYLRVVINASKIPDIARINDVVWIALYTEPKLF